MEIVIPKPTFLIIAIMIISCSKEKEATNRTETESLLQHTWLNRKTTLYKPDGELADVQIISPQSHSFTFGTDLFCFWDTPSSKTPYRLLADDSTLILEYYSGSAIVSDTNYITTLNENLLTFHGKYEPLTNYLT